MNEIEKGTERGTEVTKDQDNTILSQGDKKIVIIMIENGEDVVQQKAITTAANVRTVIATVVKEEEIPERRLTTIVEEVDHVMEETTKETKIEITGTGMKVTRLQEKAKIRYMD